VSRSIIDAADPRCGGVRWADNRRFRMLFKHVPMV